MTYEEYCILDYIVNHRKEKHYKAEDMRRWLDYFERYCPEQDEVDRILDSLVAQSLLIKEGSEYYPSEEIKALWKSSRSLLRDIVGAESSRARFKREVRQKYGIEDVI